MSTSPPTWTLLPARADERTLLDNMIQLYLHDFCDFYLDDVDESGRFGFTWLDRRWGRSGFHALLLRLADRPAGFALVEEIGARPEGDRHPGRIYLAEFGVLRAYRGQGLGETMARTVLDGFPGPWHVEEIPRNRPAQRFWRRVIGAYTGNRFVEEITADGDVAQLFDTRDRAPVDSPDPLPAFLTPAEPNDEMPPPASAGEWTLTAVTAGERPLLDRLYQYYLHDIVHPDAREVDETGRFPDDGLADYWTRPGYHALLLRARGRPVGFALLEEAGAEENSSGGHYVADFFVLRSYRRHGYGLALTHALFDRFPGRWVIEQIPENPDATAFWRRAIEDYVGDRFAESITEDDDVRQTFETGDRVSR